MANNMTAHQKAKALEALLDRQNNPKHSNRGMGDSGGDDVHVNLDNDQQVDRFASGDQQARGHL